jgi:hypothetical protein
MPANDPPPLVLDSLPYVETLHEDYEEYALAMIEEEMQKFQPRALPKMPPLKCRTDLMQQEYETLVQENQYVPREPISLVQPIATPKTIDEAQEAIKIARSRLEAERIRGMIIDAEKDDAVEGWKQHLQDLQQLHEKWTKLLESQRGQVEEINYQRQQLQQQQVGPELTELDRKYNEELYRRNEKQYQIIGFQRELQR